MKEVIEKKVENLSNLQQFLRHLKARDIGGMVGAITAIFSEYFGPKEEEKKEEQKESGEPQESVPQAAIHKKLSKLKSDIKAPETSEETLDTELINPNGSDKLFIGDSILHGFQWKFKEGQRPKFIGKDGLASNKALEKLKEADKSAFKSMKEAVIYTGGNNVESSSPESIVADMVAMAKICEKSGIPKSSSAPASHTMSGIWSAWGVSAQITGKSAVLSLGNLLLEAYAQGRFPGGTLLFDLYEKFRQPEGNLLAEEYATKGRDVIHPRKAYVRAINMIEEGGEALSREDAQRVINAEKNQSILA